MGYILQKLWETFGKNVGYNLKKLWVILGKNYGLYYWIYWLKIVGYIWQNYKIYRSTRYVDQNVRDIVAKLWDIQ